MNELRHLAVNSGLELTGGMLEQFSIYAGMMIEWNSRVNLTAITAPDEIAMKHFLDSLLLLRLYEIPAAASVIDVGTGAGFPGIPLKIARPDLDLTLLDSLNKRITFLREVSGALGQENRFVHARAEDAAGESKHRECYDVVLARAVAALPVLCEYCLPFVKVGGVFLAMKGPDCGAEIETAKGAIGVLGAELISRKEYSLSDGAGRTLVVIRKSSQTPAKYPRRKDKMIKSPL